LFKLPARTERVRIQYHDGAAAAHYADLYLNPGPEGRFFRERLTLVQKVLAACPGGDLLDAGCGPGILVRTLLETRPRDFRITVLDQSLAMVEHCTATVQDVGRILPAVGQLEAMPFADFTFDTTLVMGALEYSDLRMAVREISRVTRPGGFIIATMLNPLSPYRIAEWFCYWPVLRLVGLIEKVFGVSSRQRHGAHLTGIRAVPAFRLRQLMAQAGMCATETVYFHLNSAVPPFDRHRRTNQTCDNAQKGKVATRGMRRFIGTAYLVVAKRELSRGLDAVEGDRFINTGESASHRPLIRGLGVARYQT